MRIYLFFSSYFFMTLTFLYSVIMLARYCSRLFVFKRRNLEVFENIKLKFLSFCENLKNIEKKDDADLVFTSFLDEIKAVASNFDNVSKSVKRLLMVSIVINGADIIEINFDDSYDDSEKEEFIKQEIRRSLFYEFSLSYVYSSILKFAVLAVSSAFFTIFYFHTFYLYFKFWF